jgi:glucokinase
MAVIALDLGGTKVKLGIIEKDEEIISVSKLDALPGITMENNLNEISNYIRNVLAENKIHLNKITAIGISVPSIVDDNNKVLSRYVKYTDANEFDFNMWAKQEWNLPVVVENDARAALIGEWKYGAGKGYNDIALLTLGTGVGSAVLNDGKLYKGKHFLAGSMSGHVSINYDGDDCNCGFFGCLETEASTWALPAIIARHSLYSKSSLAAINKPEFINVFEEADKNDELAKIILKQSLKAWGTCAVNLVHCYDPELIIISGGIMKRKEIILPFIQQMVDKYAWLSAGTIKIAAAEQTEYAGVLGLAYLAQPLTKQIEN